MTPLGANIRKVKIKRDPNCPCCGAQPDARIVALAPALYAGGTCDVPDSPRRRSSNTNERFLRDLRDLRGETDRLRIAVPDSDNPPLEVDVRQARAWIESKSGPLVLDVREPYEVALCSLPDSLAIPLAQMAERLNTLPRDRPILTLCHHGGRSLQAARFLRAKGLVRSSSLRGGIHEWAETFDPTMPKY